MPQEEGLPSRRAGGGFPGGGWPGGGGYPGGGYPGGGRQGRRGGSMGMAAGTVLYDAVYLASNDLMKRQHGRKALIVLSDGVDTGSKESLISALEAAQRTDTLVYSILFSDDSAYQSQGGFGFPGGGGMGRRGGGWPGG